MTKTTVEVNGRKIKLMDFPEKMITNAIIGMLQSLRGIDDEITTAVITIESADED